MNIGDFKDMLVYIIDSEGKCYSIFYNEKFRYHVDALNYIYNIYIKKWYKKEKISRQLSYYFDLLKDYVIILSNGKGEDIAATVIIPDNFTYKQYKKLEYFEEIFKKCFIVVCENGNHILQERNEDFKYDGQKQYIKR